MSHGTQDIAYVKVRLYDVLRTPGPVPLLNPGAREF